MHYYCGLCSQFWLYEVVFPECTCEWKSLDHTTLQSGVELERDEHWLLPPALPVDFILHPAAAAVAAPTLSFGALVNIVGDEAALPLWAWHILIITALGVLGRNAGVLCRHVRRRATVQFGNVAKGVRSLYGVW